MIVDTQKLKSSLEQMGQLGCALCEGSVGGSIRPRSLTDVLAACEVFHLLLNEEQKIAAVEWRSPAFLSIHLF